MALSHAKSLSLFDLNGKELDREVRLETLAMSRIPSFEHTFERGSRVY